MPAATAIQLMTPSSTAAGMNAESVDERLLSCLCMQVCGKYPDGTAVAGTTTTTTLTYLQYRNLSQPIVGSQYTVPAQDVRNRILALWSMIVANADPNGATVR